MMTPLPVPMPVPDLQLRECACDACARVRGRGRAYAHVHRWSSRSARLRRSVPSSVMSRLGYGSRGRPMVSCRSTARSMGPPWHRLFTPEPHWHRLFTPEPQWDWEWPYSSSSSSSPLHALRAEPAALCTGCTFAGPRHPYLPARTRARSRRPVSGDHVPLLSRRPRR